MNSCFVQGKLALPAQVLAVRACFFFFFLRIIEGSAPFPLVDD